MTLESLGHPCGWHLHSLGSRWRFLYLHEELSRTAWNHRRFLYLWRALSQSYGNHWRFFYL